MTRPAPPGPAADDDIAAASAAFPTFPRVFAVLIIVLLAVAAAGASEQLRHAVWTPGSVVLLAAAWVCIAWMGWWIFNSRTRLAGDTLVQSWIWTKRARAGDVAQLKLVHIPLLDWIVAPRLLVRLRSGAMLWFQAADVRVLQAFCDRVARHRSAARP